MEKIINLAKWRGFVYPWSDIYWWLANTWDYGPLWVELKNNIRDSWWKYFIQNRIDMVWLDSAILLNPKVWEASGHIWWFSDPLIDCKECKSRHRADKLIEDYWNKKWEEGVADWWDSEKTKNYMLDNKIACPKCKSVKWWDVKEFNLMFETKQWVTEDSSSIVYMRPETAQGIFIDFKSIAKTSRKKLPFWVWQVGKAFRNEITPWNFIFRTREFEQMEIEYFVKPWTEDEWHKKWEKEMYKYLYDVLQINNKTDFKLRWHNKDELSHYSSGTFDIEYKFPFGWSELWGCASRTDFDLTQHEKFSWQDMKYFDPITNQKYIPYVVEPTFWLTRTLLMILCDAFCEEKISETETRTVLKLAPELAPIKVAILPLTKKLKDESIEIYNQIAPHCTVEFDIAWSIGKRYRRYDEIGTPHCITIDYDTTGTWNNSNEKFKWTITVRDRDTMEQKRMTVEEFLKII